MVNDRRRKVAKAPSSKSEILNESKIGNPNTPNGCITRHQGVSQLTSVLDFGFRSFEFVWDLVLRIWDFGDGGPGSFQFQ